VPHPSSLPLSSTAMRSPIDSTTSNRWLQCSTAPPRPRELAHQLLA
jgi:hypothetical protein